VMGELCPRDKLFEAKNPGSYMRISGCWIVFGRW